MQQHWQMHNNNVSKAVGTDPLQLQDVGVQVFDRCDAGCQASTSGRGLHAGASRGRQDAQLSAFLGRVAPAMLAALASSGGSVRGGGLSVRQSSSSRGQQEVGRSPCKSIYTAEMADLHKQLDITRTNTGMIALQPGCTPLQFHRPLWLLTILDR